MLAHRGLVSTGVGISVDVVGVGVVGVDVGD